MRTSLKAVAALVSSGVDQDTAVDVVEKTPEEALLTWMRLVSRDSSAKPVKAPETTSAISISAKEKATLKIKHRKFAELTSEDIRNIKAMFVAGKTDSDVRIKFRISQYVLDKVKARLQIRKPKVVTTR